MSTTKPMGPYELYVTPETTEFAYKVFAVTDAMRCRKVSFGALTRERVAIDESRPDRGTFAEAVGRYNEVPWSIEARLTGKGGTPGTAVAPWHALMVHAAGLTETLVGSTSCTWAATAANPAGTVSMYRIDRNALLGEYLIGAICSQVKLELGKDGAEPPKITWSGMAAKKWEVAANTLAAEIATVGATSMTLTSGKCIRTGSTDDVETGLEIYLKIESEVIKLTGITHSTGVCVIERACFSTSAATHATALAVYPYKPTPTYGDAGLAINSNDWTASDGNAVALRALTYTLETGRKFSDLESGSSSANGYVNGALAGSGQLGYKLSTGRFGYLQDLDRGTELDIAVTCGATAGSIFTINLDHCRLTEGVPLDLASNEPLEIQLPFKTRDTATALAQFNMACT